MFITSHASYSVIANFIILKLLGLPFGIDQFLLSALAGILPDIDEIIEFPAMIKQEISQERHRSYLTHTPVFWIVVLIILYFIVAPLTLLIFAIGLLLHFIFDSIEESKGIMWLYPFKDKFYTIIKLKDVSSWFKYYWTRWYYVLAEIVGIIMVGSMLFTVL
jgi:hypothetical protein